MEKITLQNNFSWQDVINFLEPGYSFGSNILERSSSIRSLYTKNMELFINGVQNTILKRIPDFDLNGALINYMLEVRKDDNGKNNLYIDPQHFLTAVLILLSNADLEDYDLNFLNFENEHLRDDFEKMLRLIKCDLTNDINFISDRPDSILGLDAYTRKQLTTSQAREVLLVKRKKTVWFLKHIDEILDALKVPVDLNVLNGFDKDKFLFLGITYSFQKANILVNGNVETYDKDSLHIVNDYILLVDYIRKEGNEDYNYKFDVDISAGNILISNVVVEEQFNKFIRKNPEFAKECNFATSYEELLSNKASESFKAINNKKLVANIKLNWEMIPSGSKVKLSNYTGTKRVVTNGKTDSLKLQKAYDLLEDKIEYFKNSGYLFELSGINTFEGYQAYMYNNGVVVFEKFFKNVLGKGKQLKLVPVTGEAIYAMNFREFAELSKYSKTELIQEMVDFNNTDVDRINHTSNGSWKNRVDKVISGPGYGGIDLDVVNDLSKDLVKKI